MFDEPDASRLAADLRDRGETPAAQPHGAPGTTPDPTHGPNSDNDGDIDWDAYYAEVFRRTKPTPPPLRPIRRRLANGSILAAIALGFREVFDPEKPDEAVVAESPGDPDRPDKPFHLELDPDDPKATRAIVRLWAKPADGGATAD